MRIIILFLLALLAPFAAFAADPDREVPRWSLEIKGGRFVPDIENWSQHYGQRYMPEFAGTLAYKIYRQMDVGVGAGKAQDTGKAYQPLNNNSAGSATYELVPVQAFVLLRGVKYEDQVLVPYVAGGWTHIYYRTTVPDNQTVRGSANGYHYRAGLQLLLNGLDRKASTAMYRDYGVFHTYLFFEAERTRAKVPAGAIDLGGTAYLVGLLFEL